jgi:hypothetical protein
MQHCNKTLVMFLKRSRVATQGRTFTTLFLTRDANEQRVRTHSVRRRAFNDSNSRYNKHFTNNFANHKGKILRLSFPIPTLASRRRHRLSHVSMKIFHGYAID